MPSFSLADIQAAAEKKYGPTVISDVPGGDITFLNPLKLSADKRAKIAALDEEKDIDKRLKGIVETALKPAEAKRLLSAAKGDTTVLAEIVNTWLGSTQVGEASPSPS